MRYSFLMAYTHRPNQWNKSHSRLVELYGTRGDVEICMVVDWKAKDEWDYLEGMAKASKIPFRLEMCETGREDVYTPSCKHNQAARMARGMFYVLQPPEILHTNDVLAGFDQELTHDPYAYVVAACEAHDPSGNHLMWYHHTVHRDTRWNFCACIPAELYHSIGGFSEEYNEGVGYDDTDFLMKVRQAEIREVCRDDLLTVHQWHKKTPRLKTKLRDELRKRNHEIFCSKWGLTSAQI